VRKIDRRLKREKPNSNGVYTAAPSLAQTPYLHQNRFLECQNAGFTEIDLVSHSGSSENGEFIHSLNVTDTYSTRVETRAVMGIRSRRLKTAMA
jgi:hypothetical protein